MKSYILQNWTMLLVLAAFAIALHITVFLDKRTIRRMYVLIVAVFLLSITVFLEFGYADAPEHRALRVVLICNARAIGLHTHKCDLPFTL